MISIDFGNSYTKVGIRSDNNATTQPVKDKRLKFDREGLLFCIPTIAAQGNGDLEWAFGLNVLSLRDQADGRVFRNWKPQFFHEADKDITENSSQTEPPCPSMEDLEKKYTDFVRECIDRGNMDAICSKKEFEEREREKTQQATATAVSDLPRGTSDDDRDATDFSELAVGYFRWLRGFINAYCQVHGLPNVEKIPARITLPSLGGENAAKIVLRNLLEDAGWKIDPVNPTLSEPHANYWGMMTEGRNAVWIPPGAGYGKLSPNYRQMLEGSQLWTRVISNLDSRNDPIYWVMVADIGGFTLDFAMLGLDPFEPTQPAKGEHEGKSREEYYSYALGVRDLDNRLLGYLPEQHAEALREMLQDKDAGRLEQFHRDCYQPNPKAQFPVVRMGSGIRIAKKEWPDVRECISAFAKEVQSRAEKFLQSFGYDRVDELLLTGGGFNIPAIRDGLYQCIENWNDESGYPPPFAYVPAGNEEKASLAHGMTRNQPLIVRGATALGGASVAFDYA